MGGERLATEKRQSCYAMPESSLQYAVPSAKKEEKAGGEGSGKRLWENRKWQKFFRQVSLKIGNSGAQQRLDPPLPTTVGFIAAGSGPRRAVMYGCTGRAGRDGISCGAPRPLQRCEQ
jgi:hypothetical protein